MASSLVMQSRINFTLGTWPVRLTVSADYGLSAGHTVSLMVNLTELLRLSASANVCNECNSKWNLTDSLKTTLPLSTLSLSKVNSRACFIIKIPAFYNGDTSPDKV